MAPKPRTSTPSTTMPRSNAVSSSTKLEARSDADPPFAIERRAVPIPATRSSTPWAPSGGDRGGREHRARRRGRRPVERRPEPTQQGEHLPGQIDGVHRVVAFGGLSRELVVLGEPGEPVRPPTRLLGPDADQAGGEEPVLPGADGAAGIRAGPVQLAVHLPQETERVVVVAEPHVQAVLFDPPVDPPRAGPLPAQPPTALVHGDLGGAAVGLREPPRGGQAGHPSAEDRDAHQIRSATRRCASAASGTVAHALGFEELPERLQIGGVIASARRGRAGRAARTRALPAAPRAGPRRGTAPRRAPTSDPAPAR